MIALTDYTAHALSRVLDHQRRSGQGPLAILSAAKNSGIFTVEIPFRSTICGEFLAIALGASEKDRKILREQHVLIENNFAPRDFQSVAEPAQ